MTRYSDEVLKFIAGQIARGLSSTQIACACSDEFGERMSRNAIIGIIHRKGLRPPQLRGTTHPQQRRFVVPAPVPARVTAPAPPPMERVYALPREAVFKPLPGAEPVSLMRLTSTCCRWPIDADDGPTLYCGQTQTNASISYCATHAELACGRGTPAERAATRVGVSA